MNEDDIFNNLLEQGAIEVAGITESGEFLYKFSDSLEVTHPKLYEAAMNDFLSDVYFLWEKGFLAMNITDQNPVVTITNKAFDDKAISNLSPRYAETLSIIKNAMYIGE